jgi:uncharacterized membrane protein YfcA
MKWAVVGWPVVAAAIAAFGVAFATRHSWTGLAGALIAAPLCLYLKDWPFLHWASLVALPANFVSAAFLWRGRRDIAFTLLLPFMSVIMLIAILWMKDLSVFRGLRL